MSIVMQQLKDEIRFIISGLTCERISDWESALDEMVFHEQLATGSFRGRYPIDDDMRAAMRQIEAQGGVAPYYGAGGSRGSCVYTLRLTDQGYVVQVKNTTVKESIEFSDETGTTPEPNVRLVFKIDGKELENLRLWEYWIESDATTRRYIYGFGQVAMGRLGYTVEVKDTKTGDSVDVTDYESW